MKKIVFMFLWLIFLSWPVLSDEELIVESILKDIATGNRLDCQSLSKLARSSSKDNMLFSASIYALPAYGCFSEPKAISIYENLANSGLSEAQFALCQLQASRGHDREAVKWCYVSATGGNKTASRNLDLMKDVVFEEVFRLGVEDAKLLLKGKGSAPLSR